MDNRNVLLLSGSHRAKRTTTNALLDYLETKLIQYDYVISRKQVPFTHTTSQFFEEVKQNLQKCDVFVLCFPLYFDSLPYPLLSTLELLANQAQSFVGRKMISIIHCGLPEAEHCNNALAICKNFAEKMQFNFVGSAVFPDTGSIDGSAVDKHTRITSNLDRLITSTCIHENNENAVELIGKPSMHPLFFRIFGNVIMKYFARKNKANIFQKVY